MKENSGTFMKENSGTRLELISDLRMSYYGDSDVLAMMGLDCVDGVSDLSGSLGHECERMSKFLPRLNEKL